MARTPLAEHPEAEQVRYGARKIKREKHSKNYEDGEGQKLRHYSPCLSKSGVIRYKQQSFRAPNFVYPQIRLARAPKDCG